MNLLRKLGLKVFSNMSHVIQLAGDALELKQDNGFLCVRDGSPLVQLTILREEGQLFPILLRLDWVHNLTLFKIIIRISIQHQKKSG